MVLAKEVMQNYPEYSAPYLQCSNWKYALGEFTFIEEADDDEPVTHLVTYPIFAKGLELFHLMIECQKWRGIKPDDFFDAGDWDADTTDCALQFALFGEVIYG